MFHALSPLKKLDDEDRNNWQTKSNRIQYFMRHSRLLERVHERLIVTEETSLVSGSKEKEHQNGKANWSSLWIKIFWNLLNLTIAYHNQATLHRSKFLSRLFLFPYPCESLFGSSMILNLKLNILAQRNWLFPNASIGKECSVVVQYLWNKLFWVFTLKKILIHYRKVAHEAVMF